MRPNNNQRRGRGRSGRRPNVPARAQTYDSNGPGGRIRGNATQVYEKYAALARDAMAAGDRVLAEGLHQYAEHYYRIINDSTDPEPNRPPAPPREEVEAGQEASVETTEQAASPVDTPAQASEEEQQPPRRSRRRPRPPVGDGEPADERRALKADTAADGEKRPGDGSDEDEGLRKMLSASAGPTAGEGTPRRRKANGAAETAANEAEPAPAEEQPEATPESV